MSPSDTALSSPQVTQLLYVTAPDAKTADHLARLALEARLAACVNVLGTIQSHYWWEGQLQQNEEIALLFKTTAPHTDALCQALVAAHPYACPCVLVLPVQDGHAPFLQWIAAQTTSGANHA
jgi:periplasmic divalent cation tolerance protein